MGLPTPRLLPGFLLAVTVVAELAAVPLSWGLEPAYDTLLFAVFSCALAGTGALILTRHPRHAIGWLLSGLGVANALTGDLAQGWGLRAAVEGWPGGTVAELIAGASWLPQAALFILILLLFPTGHLPGRRWSLVAWLSVLGVVLCGPGALEADPYAVDGLPTPFGVGITLIAVAMLAALVAALRRFRSSTGVLRQQMKWFALSSSFLVLTLIPTAMLWGASPLLPVLSAVALTLWPVVIGAAILRYRLYDVDLVISRTFTYLTLTILLGLVYAGTVVVIGTFAGQGSPWATAGATLLAAAAFKLLHRRVQERVDDRFLPARQDALRSVAASSRGCGPTRPSLSRSRTCCAAPSTIQGSSCGSSSKATTRPSMHVADRLPPGPTTRSRSPLSGEVSPSARWCGARAPANSARCSRASSLPQAWRSTWPASGSSCAIALKTWRPPAPG